MATFKGFFLYFFPVVQVVNFNWKFQARRKTKTVKEWLRNIREGGILG